jgi:hypothetical protein
MTRNIRRAGSGLLRPILLTILTGMSLAACDHDSVSLTPLASDDQDPSVARIWNEVLLEGIRNDFARPTVHARNLWHISAAMYDAWSAYDDTSSPWLLGKTQNNYACPFTKPGLPRDIQLAREEAISFAAYRIIRHRFANSPGAAYVEQLADDTMAALGFDISTTSTSYQLSSPAALGNYIAACYLAYGMSDGANEANNYGPLVYTVSNPPIEVEKPGNPDIVDLDRWQQISLTLSIDQSGNVVDSVQAFVGPEWGIVDPFSLTALDRSTCSRPGFDLPVYHDPGPPPEHDGPLSAEYKWTHSLVAIWIPKTVAARILSTSRRPVSATSRAIRRRSPSIAVSTTG